MNNIDEILALMDGVLDKAVAVPFSGRKSLIDVETMNDLVNEMRQSLPVEITQAREVVSERKAYILEAEREAERIIKKAEERAAQMISSQEITRRADAAAKEMMQSAHHKANELRAATNAYIEEMLAKTEEPLIRSLTDIKKTRAALRNPVPGAK